MPRRMRSTLILGVFALVATQVTSAAGAPPTNLIVNGGFERPVLAPGTYTLVAKGHAFRGWRVVGAAGNVAPISGAFVQNGFRFTAKAGKQWLDMTGTTQTRTGVSQVVATSPGRRYSLRFSVGNIVDPSGVFGSTSSVAVWVNGTRIAAVTNSRGAGSTVQTWRAFAVTFRATSKSTTIWFTNRDPATDTTNGLDGVSLIRV